MRDVAGIKTIAAVAVIPTIRIGGLTLLGAPAAFADAHAFRQFGLATRPAMLLGMDMLRAFRRVAIDFSSRKVRFTMAR